jgi:hypothetical protein
MHAVQKPETVVRAVAVYEWTGDEAKPTGSRLVPVSVFIDNQLEDAGIYMARPVPFALYTGTIFEVQKSGVPEGTVQLAYERHLEGNGQTQFDDGWLGYGAFKPAAQASTYVAKKSGPVPQVVASGGTRPHFGNQPAPSGTNASADDSSRPTMKRRTDSGSPDATPSSDSSSTASADTSKPTLQRRTDSSSPDSTPSTASDSAPAKTTSSTPASDDPDRPTLKRRTDSDDTTASTDATASTPASTSGTSSGSTSQDDSNRPTMRRRTSDSTDSSTTDTTDDADRPTLKKRTPTTQGKNQKRPGDQASVQNAVGSLNDDPDRPTLHRGTGSGGPEIPPLNGLPADMHQMVAVSDAKDRPEHDFTRQWDSDVERAEVLAKMEEFARARLAKYDVPAPPAAAPAPAPAPTPAKTAARTTAKSAKPTPPPPPPPPPPTPLADEQLRGYTLSYGGAATFVYSASSPGINGATRYVSIVAQREPLGELKIALSSATDSTHLDRTPWMRLVDVVDAEASNRASLLFEMRSQGARQFALYRVIGASAEQIFQTGTTE